MVVASPDPLYVSGSGGVKDLLERDYVVITAGGGDIPVITTAEKPSSLTAVVDKDLTSEKIATSRGTSKFVSLTDAEGAYLDYTGPKKKLLRNVTAKEMKFYLRNGEFGKEAWRQKQRLQ